jgi:hypothetical protein
MAPFSERSVGVCYFQNQVNLLIISKNRFFRCREASRYKNESLGCSEMSLSIKPSVFSIHPDVWKAYEVLLTVIQDEFPETAHTQNQEQAEPGYSTLWLITSRKRFLSSPHNQIPTTLWSKITDYSATSSDFTLTPSIESIVHGGLETDFLVIINAQIMKAKGYSS